MNFLRLGASNLVLKELQIQPRQQARAANSSLESLQVSIEAKGIGSAKLWARTCSEEEVFQDCWKVLKRERERAQRASLCC